jgi:hypothetical protein
VELDVPLAAEIDFVDNFMGNLRLLGVSHLLHGLEKILLVDGTVVVRVEVLERLLQVLDFLGIELSSHVELGLVQRSDTDTSDGGDGLALDVGKLQASQVLWMQRQSESVNAAG